MEDKKAIPKKISSAALDDSLAKIANIVSRMIDSDIFPWLTSQMAPTTEV